MAPPRVMAFPRVRPCLLPGAAAAIARSRWGRPAADRPRMTALRLVERVWRLHEGVAWFDADRSARAPLRDDGT
jgi:hypothetical protein